jgi:hypothetical protein
VEHHAHQARGNLHARGAHQPRLLVLEERFFEVAFLLVRASRQAQRILERHGGALRQILQHEVGGVAQQRHRPLRPVLDRLAKAQHPAPERPRHAQNAHRLLAVVGEERQHFLGRCFLVVS